MGNALNMLWTTLVTVLEGINAFASAFKSIGNVADETAKEYEEEARQKRLATKAAGEKALKLASK